MAIFSSSIEYDSAECILWIIPHVRRIDRRRRWLPPLSVSVYRCSPFIITCFLWMLHFLPRSPCSSCIRYRSRRLLEWRPVKRSSVKWENWGKCLQADGKSKFLVNFRSWTNGKKFFPFVRCLHQVLWSQCSIWTNGNIILPFVRIICRDWTNGKLVFNLLDLSFQVSSKFQEIG